LDRASPARARSRSPVCALADGAPFLGRTVDRLPSGCNIVVLNLEMAEPQWNRWAKDTGVRKRRWIYPVHLRGSRFAITDETTRIWLTAFLREANAHWIVLDSWGKGMANCGLNENSPADVNLWTAAWDEIKKDSGTPNSLVVAHSSFKRKKGHGDDDKELARGGTSLEDWADSIWRLRSERGTRFFGAEGRDVVIPETAVNYDPATRLYTPGYGTRPELHREKDAEELAAVVQEQPGINKTALRKAMNPWAHSRTDSASRKAEEDELIHSERKGKERQYFPGPKP
jgi:AAA domain-containing protein